MSAFLDIAKFADFRQKKMLMSAELKGIVTWFIYSLDFHYIRYNLPSFIIVGYVWQILGTGSFLHPPIHDQPHPKKLILVQGG